MNNLDRKELERALELIEDAKEIIEIIRDSEDEKFNNLSENLQQSERGQRFEENVSTLDDVISDLENAIDNINQASE